MQRRVFDQFISLVGLFLTALLIVGGSLLTWASNYVSGEVHSQLSAQKVYFPPAGPALADLPTTDRAAMEQYAGQQLVNGDQAEVYANSFIGVHLAEVAGGQTYAQLSTKAQANPQDQKLAGQVATMFKGETLRGLLLNAYAFGKMGSIAGIGAIVAFVGAGIMLALTGLGWRHSRAVPHTERALDGSHERIQPTAKG